jgi:protein XagA
LDKSARHHDRRKRGGFLVGKSVPRTCAALAGALAVALCAAEARAGGWPLPPGQTEIILNISRLSADERYDSSGNRVWTSNYRKLEISPYIEHGVSGRLTLVGEFAYMSESTNFFGREIENDAFSRLKLGARQVLGEWNDTLFSFQPVVTFHFEGEAGDPAATESGDIDVDAGLVLARNDEVAGFAVFSVQEIAWRYRDDGRPDEVRADITLGTRPWKGGMLLLKSLNEGALETTAAGDLYRSSKLGFSIVQELPQADAPGWSAEIGIERTVFGRSTIDEATFRIALWRRF